MDRTEITSKLIEPETGPNPEIPKKPVRAVHQTTNSAELSFVEEMYHAVIFDHISRNGDLMEDIALDNVTVATIEAMPPCSSNSGHR